MAMAKAVTMEVVRVVASPGRNTTVPREKAEPREKLEPGVRSDRQPSGMTTPFGFHRYRRKRQETRWYAGSSR